MNGKGGKLARVALNERTARVVRAVAACCSSARTGGAPATATMRLPSPYTQQAISWLLVDLAHVAGLLGAEDGEVDRMHPHRLRHTFVTILLNRGQALAASGTPLVTPPPTRLGCTTAGVTRTAPTPPTSSSSDL